MEFGLPHRKGQRAVTGLRLLRFKIDARLNRMCLKLSARELGPFTMRAALRRRGGSAAADMGRVALFLVEN